MTRNRVDVPCGTCRLCCISDLIVLHDSFGDDLTLYDYEVKQIGQFQMPVLKRRADGACIYLDDKNGCTIHDYAPAVCREFDCRGLYKRYTQAQRRELISRGMASKDIFEAGRKRLEGDVKDK